MGDLLICVTAGTTSPAASRLYINSGVVWGAGDGSFGFISSGGSMATRLWFFILVSLFGTRGGNEVARELIVWNVGQGQWATLRDEQGCWHFDMGGEFAPWSAIISRCRARANFVSLSHWDWDHIGFVGRARMHLPDLCLLDPPLGSSNEHKERMLRTVRRCDARVVRKFESWVDSGSRRVQDGKSSNGLSRVVSWRGVLTPGDSTSAEEKIWALRIQSLARTRILVLGHHGSRTSTSDELLHRLPQLRIAIASQRRRRYGHPHAEVVRRLEKHRVPLLLTEDWGTIHIPL